MTVETEDNIFITDWKNYRNKGKSLLELPMDYVVIDIETTGLDPSYDEIIELSAVKVKNDEIVDKFTTLCRPEQEISSFITELTGITNDMAKDAPIIDDVLESYISFIGDDIIIGHNVNFDINFIYDNYFNLSEKSFGNNFIDTMRLSRRVCFDLAHHRLSDMIEYYNIISEQSHRGLSDCVATHQVYLKLKEAIINNNISLAPSRKRNDYSKNLNLKNITATVDDFDETHPCYGKYFVFTGALKIARGEAAQIVANLGGTNENSITKKTNYLVLGNYDYSNSIKDGKSSKHKKAEEYILKGQDLTIITENVFFDIIGDENITKLLHSGVFRGLEKAIKEEEWSKRINFLENIMGDDLKSYIKESRNRLGTEIYLNSLEKMLIEKYKRIAIDSYKQEKYQDVIDICQKAISENLPGDWENRISRAGKKLKAEGPTDPQERN
jgi:DNA polymerase-3 subunit epsilon